MYILSFDEEFEIVCFENEVSIFNCLFYCILTLPDFVIILSSLREAG